MYPAKHSTTSVKAAVSMLLILSFVITNAVTVFASVTPQAVTNSSAYARFTTDLTQLARTGRLHETPGFQKDAQHLIDTLAAGSIRQPVIIDEKGDAQSAIVESAARLIAAGSVPDSLKDVPVIKVETDVLFSNLRSEKESAAAIASIVDVITASNRKAVLYLNEVANYLGNDAAVDKIESAVASGKVAVIGGSSRASYDERIESSARLSGIFQAFSIDGGLTRGNNDNVAANRSGDEEFRGDNISPDLREMMAKDPTGRTRVDVILQAKDADNASLRALLVSGKARIADRIGNSDTLVVNLPLSVLNTLSTSGTINYVSPDRPTTVTGHVEDATGASAMRSQPALNGRSAYTLDGSGIGVAVLDSGIQATHKGFKNSGNTSRIIANVNFTNATLNDTTDGYGHGTHVAGLAVGSANNQSGAYRGIAPNANIVSVKVLNNLGQGQTSWLLNGLNWVLQNRTQYNIKVANLSLGTTAVDSYTNDPVCVKVKELVNAGITVVVAAGNLGKNDAGTKLYGQIHSPGNSPYAITVGAANSYGTASVADDTIATYSSRGPTRSYFTTSTGWRVYDNLIKPDLVAPGNKLISYRAANNLMSVENPLLNVALAIGETGDDATMYMSGTSMATPIVTGAAALLLQVNPNLTPGMIKMLLQYTARPVTGANTFEQGAGEINIDGAVRLARSLRTDLDFQTASNGTSTVPAGWTMPTPNSTIGDSTFPWSQMIIGDHTTMSGQNMVSQFQSAYKRSNTFGDGVGFANGGFNLDTANYFTSGLNVNRYVTVWLETVSWSVTAYSSVTACLSAMACL